MTIGDNLLERVLYPEFSGRGLLRDLDPHHLCKLAGLALEARFDPGHVIFHQGDLTGFFYLIVSGFVELESVDNAGRKHVQTLGPGDAFGWSSVLDGERKHSLARAASNVIALAFDGHELRLACDQDPEFGYAFMKRLLSIVASRLETVQPQAWAAVGSPA